MEGGGLGKSWKVEAGTGRVKVGMSELEMLFRPLGKTTVLFYFELIIFLKNVLCVIKLTE
jgi:hypothetical protein